MRLEEFTYLPLDVREKALRYLANMMGEPHRPLDQLASDLEGALDRAASEGLFSYLREEQPGRGPRPG